MALGMATVYRQAEKQPYSSWYGSNTQISWKTAL